MMATTVLVKIMIKSILKYLQFSNVNLIISLNPLTWKVYYEYHPANQNSLDPHMRVLYIRLLMFKLEIVIDDGTW